MTATASSLKSPTYAFGPAAGAIVAPTKAVVSINAANPTVNRLIGSLLFEFQRRHRG
jgi:hypothetical protein